MDGAGHKVATMEIESATAVELVVVRVDENNVERNVLECIVESNALPSIGSSSELQPCGCDGRVKKSCGVLGVFLALGLRAKLERRGECVFLALGLRAELERRGE